MERLTQKAPDSEMVWFKNEERLFEPCEMSAHESRLAIAKLAAYEQAEEQGLLLRSPCKVGDMVYVIDRGEDNTLQVYEGKWECVSLFQTSKDGSFNLRGEISYDIYDCFYDDGRTMKHGMYVGQESTKIGKVVFFTRAEAEAMLAERLKVWNKERRSYQSDRRQ